MELIQNIESIDVPVINGSKFQVLCHAQAKTLVKEAETWLRLRAQQSGCEDKEGEIEKLIASEIALLTCQCYPHSPDSKVTFAFIKLMFWLFIFDEVMDDSSTLGTDPVATQQFCGFILQAFFCRQSLEALAGIRLLPMASSFSSILSTLAITVLIEWWSELRVGMSARQQARFCSHFSDYVLMHVQQARFRQERKAPNPDEYLRIRTVVGAMYILEMLGEKDSEIELDEDDLRNSIIKRLNETIGQHASILNDYVGLAHEYQNGDHFNLPMVLHYRNNIDLSKGCAMVSFQKACTEAWEMTKVLEEECIASAKEVHEWAHKFSKPGLLNYVATLSSISAANWLFLVSSSRYTAFNKHLLPSITTNGVTFVRINLTPPPKV